MAIAFTPSKDGKATKIYEIFTSLMIEHTGFEPKDIWSPCVDDDAAQKVAVLESVEARVCLMYNGNKVGESAVGEIIRKETKVAIKPFPEGNNIISKANNLETMFLYGFERYEQMWKLVNALSGEHGE